MMMVVVLVVVNDMLFGLLTPGVLFPMHGRVVDELNANITSLPSLGPFSKYEAEGIRGKLELKWIGDVSPLEATPVITTVYTWGHSDVI